VEGVIVKVGGKIVEVAVPSQMRMDNWAFDPRSLDCRLFHATIDSFEIAK